SARHQSPIRSHREHERRTPTGRGDELRPARAVPPRWATAGRLLPALATAGGGPSPPARHPGTDVATGAARRWVLGRDDHHLPEVAMPQPGSHRYDIQKHKLEKDL